MVAPSLSKPDFDYKSYSENPPKSASEAIAWLNGFLGKPNLYMALGIRLEGPGVPIMHSFLAEMRARTMGKNDTEIWSENHLPYLPDGTSRLEILQLITEFLENVINGLAFHHSPYTSEMFKQVFSVFENLKIAGTHNKVDNPQGFGLVKIGDPEKKDRPEDKAIG